MARLGASIQNAWVPLIARPEPFKSRLNSRDWAWGSVAAEQIRVDARYPARSSWTLPSSDASLGTVRLRVTTLPK